MSGFFEEVYRGLEGARGLPHADREAYLARATASEDVRATVRRLLAGAVETLPAPLTAPAAGRTLGDFVLLEELGRGAVGIVYRARQRSLERLVAVKVLAAGATSARDADRFEREAHAAARLVHPHLVAVHSVGRASGARWLAMELCEGGDLARELARRRVELGVAEDPPARLASPRPPEFFRWAAEVVRQAADGLAHAHAHGLVHRGLHPRNVLLGGGPGDAPRVKLADFGLARDEGLGCAGGDTGDAVDPRYTSPEQARALRERIDPRTDVWSLGAILHELLALCLPPAANGSVLGRIVALGHWSARHARPDVPRELAAIAATAMARSPADRYAAAELRDDLARWLAGEAPAAPPRGAVRSCLARLRRVAARETDRRSGDGGTGTPA